MALDFGLSWTNQAIDADIIAPGSTSDEHLAAYYQASDLFLCLSEHEGFGVPLVEAMYFDLPIVAHDAAAAPEILREAGRIVDKSNLGQTLAAIDEVLQNPGVRRGLISSARKRREDFCLKRQSQQIINYLESFFKALS
jgi:glycosyltransferase involved in cell wall biosynthesis